MGCSIKVGNGKTTKEIYRSDSIKVGNGKTTKEKIILRQDLYATGSLPLVSQKKKVFGYLKNYDIDSMSLVGYLLGLSGAVKPVQWMPT